MRCRQCEYTLWNLPTRNCPECGGGFLPSDYEFAPNAVQFCCPHCNQPYYGTDEKGHLVPRAFQCVKCNAPVDMDQMVLRPAAGVKDDGAMRDILPWLAPGQRGFVGRWMATIGRALVMPGRLGRAIPPERPAGQAWWFAAITSLVTSVLSIGPICLFFGGLGLFAAGGGGGGGAAFAGPMMVGMLLFMAIAFGGTLVFLGLWGVLSHWLLSLVKGVTRPIGHTYAAIGYASGANLLTAVPCLGSNGLGVIWWIVSAVLALKEAQRTSGGKATFAVVTPPVVILGLFFAAYMALVFSAMTFSRQMVVTAGPVVTYATPVAQAQSMTTRLIAHAGRNGGAAPAHGLMLLDSATTPVPVWPSDFIAQATATDLIDIWMPDPATGASATLDEYFTLPPIDRANISIAVRTILPPGTPAHRVGDFVFTTGGLSIPSPDPELWLLVMCDDPDLVTGLPALDPVAIGLADGRVIAVPRSEMTERLSRQNQLRESLGLPVLPDPLTVRQFRPGTP